MSTPSSDTQNRTAIVTGGSRGIGAAISRRLVSDGYSVAIAYASRDEVAEQLVNELRAEGGSVVSQRADVGDESAVAALFDLAEDSYGGVDVVVNSAAIMPLAPLAELDLADLDRVLHTNVRGTFVVAQQAVRRLRSGGSILNFSSSVVQIARPTYSAYAASKSAVEGLTLTLAHELRGRDLTVNAVAPGPTATDMFLDGKSEELIARIAAEPPLERLGTPAEIAALVAFLVSPEGHWVNGQLIRANGGIV